MRSVWKGLAATVAIFASLRIGLRHFLAFVSYPVELDWTEQRSGREKLDLVWNQIVEAGTTPSHWPPTIEFILRFVFVGDDYRRLALPSTFRPYTQKTKILHTLGCAAQVQIEWTDEEFRQTMTGVFGEKKLDGIINISSGNAYGGNVTNPTGIAVKVFRSDVASANFLAINALIGGPMWNIFGQMHCTKSSLSQSFLLFPHARGWTKFPNSVGTSFAAKYDSLGREFTESKFPYTLCFAPTSLIRHQFEDSPPFGHPYDQLQHVKTSSHLYDIWAIFEPTFFEDLSLLHDPSIARVVGTLRTTTPFRTSQFVDRRLFFQHQPFDEDLSLRPDWAPYMTTENMLFEGPNFAYKELYEPQENNWETFRQSILTLKEGLKRVFRDPRQRRDFLLNEVGLSKAPYLFRHFLKSAVFEEHYTWPNTPEFSQFSKEEKHFPASVSTPDGEDPSMSVVEIKKAFVVYKTAAIVTDLLGLSIPFNVGQPSKPEDSQELQLAESQAELEKQLGHWIQSSTDDDDDRLAKEFFTSLSSVMEKYPYATLDELPDDESNPLRYYAGHLARVPEERSAQQQPSGFSVSKNEEPEPITAEHVAAWSKISRATLDEDAHVRENENKDNTARGGEL